METHSSILAWKIPWTEETGRLQFMWSQKSQTRQCTYTHSSLIYKYLTVCTKYYRFSKQLTDVIDLISKI